MSVNERERERKREQEREREREQERERERESEREGESDAPAHSLARKVGGVSGEGAGEVERRAAVPTRERPCVKDRRRRLCTGCQVQISNIWP